MSYHRPDTLAQAIEILAASDAQMIAGGTDVFPAHRGQILRGEVLDLTAISDLRGITQTQEGWRIGATTTWSEIANAVLPPAFSALQEAARVVGAQQVQNAGTIGGNLCNASPAADGVPPLLVLDAEVEIAALGGTRRTLLAQFIQGVRKVDLRPGEIVVAVHIPISSVQGGAAFEKPGARKYLVISIAMVAARVVVLDGKVREAAISVGAASPVACRLTALEDALIGFDINDLDAWRAGIQSEVSKVLTPVKDIRGDEAYRLQAAEALIFRAVRRAIQGAGL